MPRPPQWEQGVGVRRRQTLRLAGREEARRRKWLLLPGPRSAGRMGADRDRGEAEVNIAGEGRDIQHWHEYVCGKARGPVWPEQGAWKEGGK